MDTKLEDFTQIGNVSPERVKILIGLTGKLDSAVAAFLLKKQGFHVIGLGISLWDASRLRGKEWESFSKFCSVDDMDALRKLCDKIGVEFYAVNAQEEYFDKVMEPTIAATLTGESPLNCFDCHNFKIQILYDKMKYLRADFIATGHYAKVYKNHQTGEFNVYSASDSINDQSEYISDLSQNILSKLVLPIAELKREEVYKLASNFKLPCLKHIKTSSNCYIHHPAYPNFIESQVHEDFREFGPILDIKTKRAYGDHNGLHHYYIGKKDISKRGSKTGINPGLEVIKIDGKSNTLYVGDEDYTYSKGAQVKDIKVLKEIDRTRPTMFYMKCSTGSEKQIATVTFKNNNSAYIEFSKPIQNLNKGVHVTFYNKEGAGAKVIMAGVINIIGEFKLLERIPEEEKKDKKDEKVISKTMAGLKF